MSEGDFIELVEAREREIAASRAADHRDREPRDDAPRVLKSCCKQTVMQVGVISPTICPICGSVLVVRDSKWISTPPEPRDDVETVRTYIGWPRTVTRPMASAALDRITAESARLREENERLLNLRCPNDGVWVRDFPAALASNTEPATAPPRVYEEVAPNVFRDITGEPATDSPGI